MKGLQEQYDSEGYKRKLEEVEYLKAQIEEQKAIESAEKERKMALEKKKLRKIFNEDRVGAENKHCVEALIDRASFLRVELEYIERDIQKKGCLDFFTQGTQAMWREHPLSKVHVQYVKNYKDVISKLESYGSCNNATTETKNPVLGIINQGNKARGKYKQ